MADEGTVFLDPSLWDTLATVTTSHVKDAFMAKWQDNGNAEHRVDFGLGGKPVYDSALDPGIESAVLALAAGGVETFESCQGGMGHAYPEPTVRFHGDSTEGYRALVVALRAGLPVLELRRVWPVIDGEPTGPWWELTFRVVK